MILRWLSNDICNLSYRNINLMSSKRTARECHLVHRSTVEYSEHAPPPTTTNRMIPRAHKLIGLRFASLS